MDLFTPRSDLDLSVNFSADTEDKCARKKKISVIRKFAKVLYSHQSNYCLEQNIFTYSLVFCMSIDIFYLLSSSLQCILDLLVDLTSQTQRSHILELKKKSMLRILHMVYIGLNFKWSQKLNRGKNKKIRQKEKEVSQQSLCQIDKGKKKLAGHSIE